jgi:hypothetical protein
MVRQDSNKTGILGEITTGSGVPYMECTSEMLHSA